MNQLTFTLAAIVACVNAKELSFEESISGTAKATGIEGKFLNKYTYEGLNNPTKLDITETQVFSGTLTFDEVVADADEAMMWACAYDDAKTDVRCQVFSYAGGEHFSGLIKYELNFKTWMDQALLGECAPIQGAWFTKSTSGVKQVEGDKTNSITATTTETKKTDYVALRTEYEKQVKEAAAEATRLAEEAEAKKLAEEAIADLQQQITDELNDAFGDVEKALEDATSQVEESTADVTKLAEQTAAEATRLAEEAAAEATRQAAAEAKRQAEEATRLAAALKDMKMTTGVWFKKGATTVCGIDTTTIASRSTDGIAKRNEDAGIATFKAYVEASNFSQSSDEPEGFSDDSAATVLASFAAVSAALFAIAF